MIRRILIAIAFLSSVANVAKADDSEDNFNDNNNSGWGYCSQYNDPNQCADDRSCKYDWIVHSCVSANQGGGQPGGGGGNRACSSYDRDPRLCDSQPHCQFDYSWNRCVDSWQGGGDQCNRYDTWTCNNVPGCTWDTWSRQCVQGSGNGGNGQLRTIAINCGTGGYRYERCTVSGSVVDAYIQQSYGNCVQGRTWGYDQNGVWVDQGCRGSFRVRYYDRH